MIAWHCDANDCDSWVRADSFLAETWLSVYEADELLAHACTLDCLMRYAAAISEHTDTISL